MARKNKKVLKLRAYRDKLLLRVTELEAHIREWTECFNRIRKALQQEDTLRAYALASDGLDDDVDKDFIETSEVAAELALVYRFLIVERKYTEQLDRAVNNNDWLRVKALCADHKAEEIAHDKMLHRWSKDHGIKKVLGRYRDVEDVA